MLPSSSYFEQIGGLFCLGLLEPCKAQLSATDDIDTFVWRQARGCVIPGHSLTSLTLYTQQILIESQNSDISLTKLERILN